MGPTERRRSTQPRVAAPEKIRARDEFDAWCRGLNEIMKEAEPEQWWFRVMRYLQRTQRMMDGFTPETKSYLESMLQQVTDVLRAETQVEDVETNEQRAERARMVVHSIADIITGLQEHEPIEPVKVHTVHLSEIVNDYPEQVSMVLSDTIELSDGVHTLPKPIECIRIALQPGGKHYDIPLPLSNSMAHKGGTPRILLKLIAGAPLEMVAVELPPNDLDVMAYGDESQATREAAAMGVTPDGVEMIPNLDPQVIFAGRDTDLNGCYLSREGLTYSEKAYDASRTGHIQIIAKDRGLYGSETFYYDGNELIKNRGMYRLMKFVAEGKARSFDFTPLNQQVDLGIYWLVLCRKLAKKKNGGAIMNRIFDLAKQMGQVYEGENDIYDVLNRVHGEYAFFELDGPPLDEVSLVEWFSRKLTKFAQKTFKKVHALPSDMAFERTENDNIPYRVSLDAYTDNPDEDARVVEEWAHFQKQCADRTQRHRAQLLDAQQEMAMEGK